MRFSGIDALDAALGDLDPGKPVLVHGLDEPDLLAFALQFALASGPGGTGVLVTDRDTRALHEVGRTLGLDLRHLIAAGRLAILRYQPFVGEKILSLGGAGRVLAELKQLLPGPFPERLAFFPVQPFLSFASPDELGQSLRWFEEAIGSLPSTVLVAFPELEPRHDATVLGHLRGLCNGVMRLAVDGDGTRTLCVDKGWRDGQAGARFVYALQRGRGLHVHAPGSAPSEVAGSDEPRRLLVFAPRGGTPAGLVPELQALYAVDDVADEARAIQLLRSDSYDLLVFASSDREQVLAFLKVLRLQDLSLPVLLLTSPVKRATDRSALLLYGVDTQLYEPVHVEDVVVRAGQILRRGHVRPSHQLTKDFIRLHEQTRELIHSGQGRDPDTGLWQLPVFLQLARLHLAESHILARRLVLAGLRVRDHEISPSARIARTVRRCLRLQDPVTLLPSGMFLLLAEPSGADTLDGLVAKIEAGLAEAIPAGAKLLVASVMFPTDGASIETLLDGLGVTLGPP